MNGGWQREEAQPATQLAMPRGSLERWRGCALARARGAGTRLVLAVCAAMDPRGCMATRPRHAVGLASACNTCSERDKNWKSETLRTFAFLFLQYSACLALFCVCVDVLYYFIACKRELWATRCFILPLVVVVELVSMAFWWSFPQLIFTLALLLPANRFVFTKWKLGLLFDGLIDRWWRRWHHFPMVASSRTSSSLHFHALGC